MNKTVGRVYLTDIYNVIHSEFRPPLQPFPILFRPFAIMGRRERPIGDLADTVHVKSDQAEFRDYFRNGLSAYCPRCSTIRS